MAATTSTVFGRHEADAGGFAFDDEGVNFFSRINALIEPDSVIVDLGAGRGSRFSYGVMGYKEKLARLQGKGAKVIGLDPSPAVFEHPFLDERRVIDPAGAWPLSDGSIDLIVAEWVLEHIAEPQVFAAEVDRVLQPGGWLCALTPNAYGYVGLANRLLPEALKERVMRRVWPEREDCDVFPVHYRLNSGRALDAAFPAAKWRNCSYVSNPTPKYHGNNRALFQLVNAYQTLMPCAMRTNRLIFIQKR